MQRRHLIVGSVLAAFGKILGVRAQGEPVNLCTPGPGKSLVGCPYLAVNYPSGLAADFSGADLSYAIFYGTDLRGSDFTGANLTGACLAGADLRGVSLLGAQLGDAVLCRTRITDGYYIDEGCDHYSLTCPARDLIS